MQPLPYSISQPFPQKSAFVVSLTRTHPISSVSGSIQTTDFVRAHCINFHLLRNCQDLCLCVLLSRYAPSHSVDRSAHSVCSPVPTCSVDVGTDGPLGDCTYFYCAFVMQPLSCNSQYAFIYMKLKFVHLRACQHMLSDTNSAVYMVETATIPS